MIRALSPYYVTTPLTYPGGTVCNKYTLTIQVWDGSISGYNGSGVNEYKVTFLNTEGSNGSHDININAMIQDYIEFKQPTVNLSDTTQIIDGDNQRWVRTFNTYDEGTAGSRKWQNVRICTLKHLALIWSNEAR